MVRRRTHQQTMQLTRPANLLLAILLFAAASTSTPAQSGASTNTLDARIERARAEKQIDQRLHALAGIANELQLTNIPKALTAAEELKSLRERLAFRDSVLRRWGELAPAEAFTHVARMSEGLSKVEALRSVATAYARTNTPAAAAAALKMPAGRGQTEAVAIISEIWARTNATEALKWANNLPDSSLKHTALRNIYFVWVHSDPAVASTTVQNLDSGDVKNALLINVAQNWAVIDPSAAMKWAKSLPIQPERDLAIVIAAESWADSDPRAAADFAWKLESPDLRQRAVLAVLERWATQQPREAFDRAAKATEHSLQEQGIARVLNVCGPVCPEASQWVEQLPEGVIRNTAIETYVEAVHVWNPEAAARLGLKMPDEASRQRVVEKAVTIWMKLDPDSTKRWVAATSFSEEVKGRWTTTTTTMEF